ncbi:MarR family winged helix-turn-helix transcriptional regulator [Pseudorhodoplanes sp.]|uniref:MarR family winged helix-turn-helix transcriptional regulator n=1 Tax=Pseudorhodoplanes sp. TaxID=1934341 RepID=UPI003D140A43
MKGKAPKVRVVPLDERVSYRFSVIAKRLDQRLAAVHSKKFGISVNNWKIMRVIAFFGPLSATELGGRTGLDPDKTTRAVDTLVDRSYVIRRDDEADRRRVVLTLSAKGRRVHEKIERVANAMEAEFLSVLTGEESRTLLSSLSKLERHSSVMFGRREGWYERRHLAGEASRATKMPERPSARVGKSVGRKLVAAE